MNSRINGTSTRQHICLLVFGPNNCYNQNNLLQVPPSPSDFQTFQKHCNVTMRKSRYDLVCWPLLQSGNHQDTFMAIFSAKSNANSYCVKFMFSYYINMLCKNCSISFTVVVRETRNPTIFNIIPWVAGSLGQTTHQTSICCSKYYFFHNFLQTSLQKILGENIFL